MSQGTQSSSDSESDNEKPRLPRASVIVNQGLPSPKKNTVQNGINSKINSPDCGHLTAYSESGSEKESGASRGDSDSSSSALYPLPLKRKTPTPDKCKNKSGSELLSKVPKRDLEFFLQTDSCSRLSKSSKLFKCRECYKSHDTNQYSCRFFSFRKVRWSPKNFMYSDGFASPSDATEDDINLWLPNLNNFSSSSHVKQDPLDFHVARFILLQVGDQFCHLLSQEAEARKIHMNEDDPIVWKKPMQGVREMCDVCKTTLFNFHWVCDRCGFVVCIDCYKTRKSGTKKAWMVKGHDHDEWKWLHCTTRLPHEQDTLMLCQIIAADCLERLGQYVHAVRDMYGIPQTCKCDRVSENSLNLAINKDHLLQLITADPVDAIISHLEDKPKKENGCEEHEARVVFEAGKQILPEEEFQILPSCGKDEDSSSDSDDEETDESGLRAFLVSGGSAGNSDGTGSNGVSPCVSLGSSSGQPSGSSDSTHSTHLGSSGSWGNLHGTSCGTLSTGVSNSTPLGGPLSNSNNIHPRMYPSESGTRISSVHSRGSNGNSVVLSSGTNGCGNLFSHQSSILTHNRTTPISSVQMKKPKISIQDLIDNELTSAESENVENKITTQHFVRRNQGSSQNVVINQLPPRYMTKVQSDQLYPGVPHSWLCEGRLLRLIDPSHSRNYRLFQDQWRRGQPVIVGNMTDLLNMSIWHPDSFCKDFGDERNDLINCATGNLVPNRPMREFWEGFENFSKRLKDEHGNPMLLKLKDWPPGEDFAELLPQRFNDLMEALPLAEYTRRTGRLNLASCLPDFFVRPDLGPKMYNAYGSALFPTKGTTNLHLDISDAVNFMVYVGIPSDADYEQHIKEAFNAIDEAGCDDMTRRRVRSKGVMPGALWHIYHACDADKIRDLLNKVAIERGTRLEPHHDPIHDQSWYLDSELRDRLYKEYNVNGYAIVQCLGDAVFIPAGAPHQVRNLHNCVKVAEDFVSPENVSHCFHLTQEFRDLSDTHTNHEDKLQIKNIIFHTIKKAVSSLLREVMDSKCDKDQSFFKTEKNNIPVLQTV